MLGGYDSGLGIATPLSCMSLPLTCRKGLQKPETMLAAIGSQMSRALRRGAIPRADLAVERARPATAERNLAAALTLQGWGTEYWLVTIESRYKSVVKCRSTGVRPWRWTDWRLGIDRGCRAFRG